MEGIKPNNPYSLIARAAEARERRKDHPFIRGLSESTAAEDQSQLYFLPAPFNPAMKKMKKRNPDTVARPPFKAH